MERARRMGWWIAVPVGLAMGLALALGLDRASSPAAAASGSGFTLSVEQLRINQRIAQQGVRRANRANARLDALAPGTATAGPVGPAGPAGPGASRIAYSAPAGSPAQTVLDLDGVALSVACQAGAGGGVELVITANFSAPTTLVGTASIDAGTDPTNPGPTSVSNFQNDVPAGQATLGTIPGADGGYGRVLANALLITAGHTLSVHVAEVADGAADRCSFNGVAVPS
jgi:hypothetical protein